MDGCVCLLIHGFAGDTSEMAYLAEYLRGEGCDVRTFTLAGHGGTRREMTAHGEADWLASAEQALAGASEGGKPVVLVGFSMGGLLSLLLAHDPRVGRLVLINTPVYFWNFKVIFRDLTEGIRTRRYDRINYYRKSVAKSPVRACLAFLRVLSSVKRTLGMAEKPVLILQCTDDESVRPKSAEYLRSRLGERACLKMYRGGCHQVFTDAPEIRDDVCGEIRGFLQA